MAENTKFKWYVLRAISGKEQKVKEYIEAACQNAGLDQYVSQVLIPTEKVMQLRSNGKKVEKIKPLLPGYVLVEADLCDECFPRLRNVPNVLGFLSNSKDMKPSPVRPSDIDKMFGKVEETEVETYVDESYAVGDSVKVTEGSFLGFNGVVEEVNAAKKKLKVIVTVFERPTPMELAFNQVVKE